MKNALAQMKQKADDDSESNNLFSGILGGLSNGSANSNSGTNSLQDTNGSGSTGAPASSTPSTSDVASAFGEATGEEEDGNADALGVNGSNSYFHDGYEYEPEYEEYYEEPEHYGYDYDYGYEEPAPGCGTDKLSLHDAVACVDKTNLCGKLRRAKQSQ